MKNRGIKIVWGIVFCLVPLMAARAQVVGKIAALVDDQVITQNDVEAVMREEKVPSFDEALNGLIHDKVLLAELDRQKIEVSETEVEQALQDELKNRQISAAQLDSELSRHGLSLPRFKDRIRLELKKKRFFQKIIYPRIRLSDFDLQEYYRKHPEEFRTVDKIRFLEILLTPESVPAGSNLFDFAGQLVARLRSGANFSELARQYSRGPFAAKGGDSGYMTAASLRPDLMHLLLSLEPGKISNPVPLTNSTVLICKVVERGGSKPRPFDEVRDQIQQKYIEHRVKDEMEAYLMDARSSHFIEIRTSRAK